MAKAASSYTAKDVKKLTTQEAFQQKIGMYAGGAGLGVEDNTGVVKCFLEILDNSIDEALNGYGNIINIGITRQGNQASYSVSDEGRGIPIDRMADGQRALEVLLTDSHAGRYCPLV